MDCNFSNYRLGIGHRFSHVQEITTGRANARKHHMNDSHYMGQNKVPRKSKDLSCCKNWTQKQREDYDRVLEELDKKFEPRLKAIRESERITADDLRIVINCR